MGNLDSNFLPTTKGEYLFLFILKEIVGRKKISEIYNLSALQLGGRLDDLFEYYAGTLITNILARCIKKANSIVADIDNEASHQRLLVKYFQGSLEIPRGTNGGANLDRLASLTLEAEKSTRRDISPSTRKFFSVTNMHSCYICGETVYFTPPPGLLQVQLEHIWPQSYGGDSDPDNLLPACPHCNKSKASMILWQNAHIQSFVHSPGSLNGLSSIEKREKIAKHRRSFFQYASMNRKTLKSAALQLGPANMKNTKQISREDAIDFFNFDL